MFSWFIGVYLRFNKLYGVNPQIPGWPSYWLGIKKTGRFWNSIDNIYWSMRSLYYRYKRWSDMRYYNHLDPRVQKWFAAKTVNKAFGRKAELRARQRGEKE